MEGTTLALLGGATLATAALSAVVGMAGGITLLAVMLLFMEPLVVIPIHGAIQLVSNGSRTFIQREHVRWPIVVRYAIPLLPMGLLGLALARQIPPEGLKALIGVFVLVATWVPRLLLFGTHPERADPGRRFFVLGGVVGVVNIAIGATGPLIAPFFLQLGLSRFGLIGTKAACQACGHLAKLVVFGLAGFALGDHWVLLAVMIPMAVAGTWLGSRLLDRVSERAFVLLYKGVLTVIALRLVVTFGLG
jgi:uncharacterized membrane protein YfcA